MRRRTVLKGIAAAAAAPAFSGALSGPALAAGDPLRFDPGRFTELTTTIATDEGDKEVTYRFYKALTYVAAPVDAKYQSLNISVPVRINGTAVDASGAPILMANGIGGYMPSSVAGADGIGGAAPTGLPAGGGAVASGGNAMLGRDGEAVSNAELGLAAGYVVVEPGARGRTLVGSDGTYYGTAPAVIVDLKAAVRYLRHNAGRIPGDVEHIVTSGTSAGGAMSALQGASADSPLYEPLLREIGAAEQSDAIFASGDWCPIADLEHADMAYEWNWGANRQANGQPVDQELSAELRRGFAEYQASLGITGSGFGALTADNYGDYLLRTYLRPAAGKYLRGLSEADRTAYLRANPFITYSGGQASFGWSDFLAHVGARKKGLPAFDAFDLSAPENNLFGTGKTAARHFTTYSLRHQDPGAQLDPDIPGKLALMNPMHFLAQANPARPRHWWIRVGTSDSDTSLTVVGNLAARLQNLGDDVNAAMYWDGGHGANEDAGDFIRWIARITGYRG